MARLEVRLSVEQKNRLRRAAELSGCSLGEFVIAAACDAAEHVIAGQQSPSRAEQIAFVEALFAPAPPSPRLRRAADDYRRALGD